MGKKEVKVKEEVEAVASESAPVEVEVEAAPVKAEVKSTKSALREMASSTSLDAPALSDEDKDHIKYLCDWAVLIGRKSNNVEFRTKSKAAIAALSKLL